jgi:hypothetical protein
MERKMRIPDQPTHAGTGSATQRDFEWYFKASVRLGKENEELRGRIRELEAQLGIKKAPKAKVEPEQKPAATKSKPLPPPSEDFDGPTSIGYGMDVRRRNADPDHYPGIRSRAGKDQP